MRIAELTDWAQRRLLIAGFVGLVFSGISQAAPTCGVDTLADYIASSGCSIGIFTINDFAFASQGVGSPTLLLASQITVTPTINLVGGTFDFQFQPNSAPGFSVLQNQSATYFINYDVDPHPPVIHAMFAEETRASVVPVQLTEDLCEGALFTGPTQGPASCSGTFQQLVLNGPGSPSTNVTFPTDVGELSIRNTLNLTGSFSVGAQVDSFDNQTTVSDPSVLRALPEPATPLFVVLGLLGLFVFQGRAKLCEVLLKFRS